MTSPMMTGQIQAHAQSGNERQLQPRVVAAAREFEAQMMKELLRPLTASTMPGGEAESTGSNTALQDFATEALGRALSAQGGLGISGRLLQALFRCGTSPEAVQNGDALSMAGHKTHPE